MPSKVAAVAGAGGGIGRAISLGLARDGLVVAGLDIDGGELSTTANAVSAIGGEFHSFVADTADMTQVERAVEKISAVGPLFGLVHAVGIYPRSRIQDMDEEEWDRVLRVNLKSVFVLTRSVIPHMATQKAGRIVVLTSELGSAGSPAGAHYAASKGAINAFIRSAAADLGRAGITVNGIAPGLTDTPLMRGANSPEYIAEVTQRLPQGRLGQPEDVLPLVRLLLAKTAGHISGQIYPVR